MMTRSSLFGPLSQRAIRRAAEWHRGQVRRGSGVPYVEHVYAVALILDRAGFDEEVVVAGVLHDAVEDTEATMGQVRDEFGPRVASLVGHCSEVKLDADGRIRPWAGRKRDHLSALSTAPSEAAAIVLADKLHNLLSIKLDLDEGRPVWSTFHADRAEVLAYYRGAIEVCAGKGPGLAVLADACWAALAEVGGGDSRGVVSDDY